MAEQPNKKEYKVAQPLMAFRTRNGARAFEPHRPGESALLTDPEAKALAALRKITNLDGSPVVIPDAPAAAPVPAATQTAAAAQPAADAKK